MLIVCLYHFDHYLCLLCFIPSSNRLDCLCLVRTSLNALFGIFQLEMGQKKMVFLYLFDLLMVDYHCSISRNKSIQYMDVVLHWNTNSNDNCSIFFFKEVNKKPLSTSGFVLSNNLFLFLFEFSFCDCAFIEKCFVFFD